MDIGVLVKLRAGPGRVLERVTHLGLAHCQVCSWEPAQWTPELSGELQQQAQGLGVTMTAFWAGYSGPRVWDFFQGPPTVGLVPASLRARRVEELKRAADFAASLRVPAIVTHVGFLPEDPNHPDFEGTVCALREVAGHAASRGVEFWFETGQETPVTLLRTIEAVGLPNLGVNLDVANLILYGKGNPVDALDVLGRYVRGVHAKDGLYPTNGRELGKETPLGQGKVNFPALLARLAELGYAGSLTIEREVSDQRQEPDIRRGIELLRGILAAQDRPGDADA